MNTIAIASKVNSADMQALVALAALRRTDSSGKADSKTAKLFDYERRRAAKTYTALDKEVAALRSRIEVLKKAKTEAEDLVRTATKEKGVAIKAALRRTRFELKQAEQQFETLAKQAGEQYKKMERFKNVLQAA